ncbi:LysM peptidoglycan-binding domain-containing protein [Marinicrinis lubricantis]|uniref:LysM peptidoglycan-binding domain-containing protein n=1 Tax=Marinicrinis lubricantis TaxID=2086470 RepID=A0ABW1IV18_9BACL
MSIIEANHFIYTVRPGDSLYSIATSLGSAVQFIEQTNALYPPVTDPGLIYPGQVLIVTESGLQQKNQVRQIVSPGNTLYRIAQRYSTNVELLAGINQIIQPQLILVNQLLLVPAFIYEVENGDTLNKIALRFGVSLSSLLEANRGRPGLSPDLIFPGYRLIIPLPTSANIAVTQPLPGETIQPGESLEGYARLFEGSGLYRILDDTGQIVANERAFQTLGGAPQFSYFSAVLQLDRTPRTPTGELWVYSRSPRDGSIQDLVQVKVRIAQ